ncbi:MAG: hypothetical protein AB7S62_12125 [Azoarcus sp.]
MNLMSPFMSSPVLSREDDSAIFVDIFALASDREELMSLEVVLGTFDPTIDCFERCLVTPAALRHLMALGDKYLWDRTSAEPARAEAETMLH